MPVPHAPEIALHLASEATELWHRTEDELDRIGLPPPYWAFAWAGGQALARYVLDHRYLVEGRTVLDVGSGSGLVAIAAMKAGARRAIAAEIDPFAQTAIAMNAQANGVAVEVLAEDPIGRDDAAWQSVLAGDMCYEQPLAERVTDWLATLAGQGRVVLLGDPGRTYLPRDRLEALAEYRVPTTRALEDFEIKRTTVWRFRQAGGASPVCYLDEA
ncbi:MAG: methyltransferase [Alphaproteobacteria bacterium]|nr:methyltransferase [Alphaproteobacteria bacterium]